MDINCKNVIKLSNNLLSNVLSSAIKQNRNLQKKLSPHESLSGNHVGIFVD